MNVTPIKTRIFKEGEDLAAFAREHIPHIPDGSIVVVTSKIVALAEGRTADAKDKERIIREESDRFLKTKHVWLTVRDGSVLANAGVDESNADGRIVLLPKDSFASAARIRTALMKHSGVKRCGVIITDSRVVPLRAGVIGLALGYAGFKGLRDYRGKKDLFGRRFAYATASVADMLASAAVLVMGEGAECRPLALIEDAPVECASCRVDRSELAIPLEDDMYLPFFGKLLKGKKPRLKQ